MLGTLLGQELRKRKTPQEKIATIQQTMQLGMTAVSSPQSNGMAERFVKTMKEDYRLAP